MWTYHCHENLKSHFFLCFFFTYAVLVRKYSQVMQRYYVQYLTGFDAIALNQMVQNLQVCPEDESIILSSICNTIQSVSVKQGNWWCNANRIIMSKVTDTGWYRRYSKWTNVILHVITIPSVLKIVIPDSIKLPVISMSLSWEFAFRF